MNKIVAVAVLGLAPLAQAKVPHLEIDMTGVEYRALGQGQYDFAGGSLADVLRTGQRNLAWLDALNAQRDATSQLQLSTPDTTSAAPIEAPHYYNREIVETAYQEALAAVPAEMRDTLLGTEVLPGHLAIDDATYLKNARLLDKIYQDASRWLSLEPYLDELAERSQNDVRGYYFLQKDPDIRKKLANWSAQPVADQARLLLDLVGLCHNSGAIEADCQAELAQPEATALTVYDKYLPGARELWESFFKVQVLRPNIVWTSRQPQTMQVPFLAPEQGAIKTWLQFNVEDEWRQPDWHLHMEFLAEAQRHLPHLEFQAGATPHVTGIGGDVIVMDANRNLQEYLNRWAIRHEYGHVLGFPDCYVEYYEKATGRMINYQLDTTNLMCSRRGHLQPQHVEALRRAYYHPE